jgi:hypothetical protein
MYSNSSSFLGGGNSQRPGGQQPQYGGGASPFGQQQPSPFAPQPTGFGQQQQQQPLQQQYTGYPMQSQPTGMQPQPTGFQPQQPQQPLQQQYTGFPGQGQQSFQTGAPPMPSIPPQFQQQFQQQQNNQPQQQQQQTGFSPTGFSSSSQAASGPSQPPAPMKPQATGFTQMAASFQAGGSSKPTPARTAERAATNKIPNIRLSFITAQDQSKFETLFKSAVGDGSTMSGDKARDLLIRSRLDGDSLSHIWWVVTGQSRASDFVSLT